jgi:hypothetical protein
MVWAVAIPAVSSTIAVTIGMSVTVFFIIASSRDSTLVFDWFRISHPAEGRGRQWEKYRMEGRGSLRRPGHGTAGTMIRDVRPF